MFCCNGVNGWSILNSKLEHVKCQVPSCQHIPWHHASIKLQFFEDLIPSGKDNSGWVLNCKRNFTQLGCPWWAIFDDAEHKHLCTLTSISFTGCTLSLSAVSCSALMVSLSSIQPSTFSSSSLSLPSSLLSAISCSSMSMLPASSINAVVALSNTSLTQAWAFGTSNCWITLFAIRLRMCVKQQVWLSGPLNALMSSSSWHIIWSLLLVLSQVILNIWFHVSGSRISLIYWLTLYAIPKSSRILANTAARVNPVCDLATWTRSSSIDIGAPFCLKWTVTATYALWFREVQVSVAKLM